MNQDQPVRDVMTTEVVTFTPETSVEAAMTSLVQAGVDGAPVVDGSGAVVGVLSSDDLIVQDTRLHGPTVISILGAYIELPKWRKEFEEEFHKAAGSTVGEVMEDDPVTVGPDDTIETAATLMHEKDVSRLPVVEGGRLVGVIARGDVLRAIVQGSSNG